MTLVLPDLVELLDRAGREAEMLVAELQDAVADRVRRGGRVDRAALDAEQHAAHGLAWAAAYAETLRQTAAWAERLIVDEAFRFSEHNQVHTANLLGISRNVVRTLLKRHGYLGLEETDAA